MNFKFSIIIPCFNAEKWIEQCLLSALKQSYENTEVIFIDNESTDNSFEIAKEIQKKHPELIVNSAPNLYKYSWEEPVEKALSLSSGEYFTILGADDYLASDYVEKIVKIISTNPDKIKLLQTPIMGIRSGTGKQTGLIEHSYKSLKEFKTLLFNGCPVNTPSVVYSKVLHDKGIVRWDSQNYLGAVDYDLYFNLAHHNCFIYPYPSWVGYHYRWHEEQATWGMHRETINYDEVVKEFWKNKWK